jgi:hypothetical protein
MVERAAAEAWIAAYIRAWLSYEPDAIGDLFVEDAEYRYHPHDTPLAGRDAIVDSWLTDRDHPGTYHAEYSLHALDGDRAIFTGVSTYFEDETHETITAVYDNCFLVEFDDDGRCRTFTEWFVQRDLP